MLISYWSVLTCFSCSVDILYDGRFDGDNSGTKVAAAGSLCLSSGEPVREHWEGIDAAQEPADASEAGRE